jgi:medium-chain acyl-[acyl-carrier-protein] hydrolase
MEKIHKELFKIKFYDTDFTNSARLYSIINYMQETSEQHSNRIGLGYESFMKSGLFWVVSRIEANIIKYPKNMDTIIMETWPSGIDKLFFKRNFRILDENQQILGDISAYYLLLDVNSKFPQRPSRLPIQVEVLENRFGVENKLDKIKMLGELINTSERTVTYSDIDLNIHVNNAKYVSWIEDAFSIDEYKDKSISNLQLNFVKEAKYGEVVILNKYVEKDYPNTYYIEGVDKESGNQFFQSRVEFTSKKG